MPPIAPPTPTLNRLRAAAGLIPIIESGLAGKTLTRQRAGTMYEFCAWAVAGCDDAENSEAGKLAAEIGEKLAQLKVVLINEESAATR